jgi:hypothetical protein
MARKWMAVLVLVGAAACTRSFGADPTTKTGAPVVRGLAVVPAVVAAGQSASLSFGADRPLTGCAAEVSGQSATCRLVRAQCTCDFLAVGSLPEGPLNVVVQAQGAGGTGTASTTLQLDKTPPVIADGGVHVARGEPGVADQLQLDGHAVVDPPLTTGGYPGQAVSLVQVWDVESGGAPIARLVPVGGGGSVALGSITAGPRHVWVSAIDLPGNESARVPVTAGDDLAGPGLDDAGIAFVRRPLGEQDQVRVDLPPRSGGCAVLGLSLFDLDGGAVATANVGDGGPTLIPIGTGTRSYPRLLVAARDRCGVEGPLVEVAGADVTGPRVARELLTFIRAPQGLPSAIGGQPGAVQDQASAIQEVRAYDGPFPDAGLRVAFGVNQDGSFPPEDAGAEALENVWLEGTDKCGNTSAARAQASHVQATLNLTGRTPYDASKSAIALYASAAPFDPREILAGPGVGPAWAAEVADASPAARRDGQGLTTVADAQVGQAIQWSPTTPGVPNNLVQGANDFQAPPALFFDSMSHRPTLISEVPTASTTAVGRVGVWDWVGTRWLPVASTGGPQANSQSAVVATWEPTLGKALVASCDTGGSLQTFAYAAGTWSALAAGSVPCDPRGLALAYDAVLGAPLLVTLPPPFFNVTTYVLRGGTWAQVPTPTTPATGFSYSVFSNLTLVFDPGQGKTLLFTSGISNPSPSGTPIPRNSWLFSGTDWVAVPGPAPSDRSQAALYFDPNLNKLVLFGGAGVNQYPPLDSGETWLLDASGWSLATPSTAPSARHGAAAVFDLAAGRPILFGGQQGIVGQQPPMYLGDTWTFDGATWTDLDPATPAARIDHALAFDNRGGQTVLFGGYDPGAGQIYGDTWAFDGASWTPLLSPSDPAPTPRYGHAMAYDSRRGRVLLFGGADSSGPLGDTWSFDGSHWSQLSPPTSPSARYEHAMTYDAARDRMVLFGGWNGGFIDSDTWEFDGASWSKVATNPTPAGRHLAGMTFDPRRGKVVLFGGSGLLADLGDTWEFDGAWHRISSAPFAGSAVAPWTANVGMAALQVPDWLSAPNPFGIGGFEPGGPLLFGGLGESTSQVAGNLSAKVLVGGPYLEADGLWRSLGPQGPFGGPPQTEEPDLRVRSAWAFDPTRAQSVLFAGAIAPRTGGSTSASLDALSATGDTWLFADQAPHRRTASHLAAVALPPGANLTQLAVSYAGSGSGDPVDGGTAGVDLLLWTTRDGGSWVALGTILDGGLLTVSPPPDDGGGFGSAVSGDQVWVQALAPSSSEPGVDGGVPSTLTTDFLEVRATYVVP